MIWTIVIIGLISLIGIKIDVDFQSDYLSVTNTKCIKGFFTGFIFLCHLAQYITLNESIADAGFDFVMGLLGQNIVIAFLLYSGYGIGEAIKKKGMSYIDSFPKKRILKTWIRFGGGIILFILLNIFYVHEEYTAGQYFMSLFALQSIGNSTWFVFAIIICWICTWIAFKICNHDCKKAVFLLIIMLIGYIIVISQVKEDHCWFDTILCYPLGLILSFEIDRVNAFLRNNIKTLILLVLSCFWIILRLYIDKNIFLYELQSLIFAVFLLAISTRIRIGNKVLNWMGEHSFSIYILQRIPMIVLSQIGFNYGKWRLLFIILTVGLTCTLGAIFDYLFEKIYNKIRK